MPRVAITSVMPSATSINGAAAVQNVDQALRSRPEDMGLVNNIFGSGFNFHIKIKEGAGHDIIDEETAL